MCGRMSMLMNIIETLLYGFCLFSVLLLGALIWQNPIPLDVIICQ